MKSGSAVFFLLAILLLAVQYSSAATLTAKAITSSPAPPISAGQSVTLTASWTGGTSTYTVAWHSGSSSTCSSDTTLVAQDSGLASSPDKLAVSPATSTYYCYTVTDKNSKIAKSKSFLLTVKLSAGAITSGPKPPITRGQPVTLYANPAGGTIPYASYKWYKSSTSTCPSSASAPPISGQTAPTYDFIPSTAAYYCYTVKDSASHSATSKSFLLTLSSPVPPSPTGLTAGSIYPTPASTTSGSPIDLTAEASGGTQPYTYQWYSGPASSSSSALCSSDTAISGATSAVYTIPNPTEDTYYCYSVTDSATPQATDYSPTDLVSINAPPTLINLGAVSSCSSPIAFGQDPLLVLGISFLALLVSFDVVAIGYILGRLVPSTGIRNWINEEFLEIAKTAMLIAGIFSILLFMSNVSTLIASSTVPVSSSTQTQVSLAPTGTFSGNIANLANAACNYLYTASYDPNMGIPPLFNYMLSLEQTVGAMTSLSVGLYVPIPIVVASLNFGYTYFPYQNSMLESTLTTGSYESMINDMFIFIVFPMSFLLTAQYALLPTIVVLGLAVLIPFGIVLRAFPFIRGIGGTLVAIGIATAIIYPSLLIIVNYPVTNFFVSPLGAYNVGSASCGGDYGCDFVTAFAPSSPQPAAAGTSDAIQAYTPYTIFPAVNGMLFYSFRLMLQFLLFIVDIAIGYPLTDTIARALGGTITLQLGGKLKLV